MVSVHIPVNTGAARREGLNEEPVSGVVANRKELYRILKPFRAHIMSGHTHCNEKVFDGENIIEHVRNPSCETLYGRDAGFNSRRLQHEGEWFLADDGEG